MFHTFLSYRTNINYNINAKIEYANSIEIGQSFRHNHTVMVRSYLNRNKINLNLGYNSGNKIITGFGLDLRRYYDSRNAFSFEVNAITDISNYARGSNLGLQFLINYSF